jgi:hypothetical protein
MAKIPGPTAPPVNEGYVRFYHGQGSPSDKVNYSAWVAQNFEYARDYRGPGSKLWYIDIKEDSPLLKKSFENEGTNMKASYVHFQVPEDMAGEFKPFPVQGPTDAEVADKLSFAERLHFIWNHLLTMRPIWPI